MHFLFVALRWRKLLLIIAPKISAARLAFILPASTRFVKTYSLYLVWKFDETISNIAQLYSWSKECQEPNIELSLVFVQNIPSILDYHNDLRRKVAKGEETQGAEGPQPGASNMRKLVMQLHLLFEVTSILIHLQKTV